MQDFRFHDLPAALLRTQIGLGQEHHTDGDRARRRLMPGAADGFGEEVLRDLDMDAGTVAGLAIGVDGTAVPDGL